MSYFVFGFYMCFVYLFLTVFILLLFIFVLFYLDIKENSYLVDLLSVDESTGLTIIPLIPHVKGT